MSLSVQALISRLEYRLGFPDDSAHRAKCLDLINDSERRIAVRGSWLYLHRRQTLTLNNTLSSVAAPTNPAMDFGKQATIIEIDENGNPIGKLRYLPADEFPGAPIADYYAIRKNRPSAWTFALDTSNIATIYFDRANTTGSGITYPIDFQRAVSDLTDAGNSFSLLPDGYEISLLMGDAEAEYMRIRKVIGWDKKAAEIENLILDFFGAQRTSKERTLTDQDRTQRAQFQQADEE